MYRVNPPISFRLQAENLSTAGRCNNFLTDSILLHFQHLAMTPPGCSPGAEVVSIKIKRRTDKNLTRHLDHGQYSNGGRVTVQA